MERRLLRLSALNGLLAVLLGAFGAHGLTGFVEGMDDGPQRLEWWDTAAHYHLTHALALGLSAWLAGRAPGKSSTACGWCFQVGIFLFSGSLYAMTLTGQRSLGMVTPLGGLFLVAGWASMLVAAGRLGPFDPSRSPHESG